ncbi:Ppx/GppA family phosphatase [Erythrobacter sp. HKB08]|uniref:Ppx/GppA family phosphatase n=1 Tax=Erythrobacter sp. HKB08 TaxID=2502843 RepID=UPI001008EED3|nr:Ppx/GppA family phosphatase [Erythrobacter sp. HKB08]
MALRRRHADRQGMFAGNRVARAIIDIGSNTVRLVLYGGSPRAPVTLFNEKVTARLGREIGDTGRLADEAVELAMRGLRRYALILEELGVSRVDVVATAAARDATNGPEFLAMVSDLGFEPRLLSGEEEAELSAMGVVGAFPGASGVVADLGGGSLELVEIADGQCEVGTSLPLGTLRLPALLKHGREKGKAAIAEMLAGANWKAPKGEPLYLVGGTWRAGAVYAMEEQGYPLTDPHGFEIATKDAFALARRLATMEASDFAGSPRISSMRAENIPVAATLLMAMIEHLEPSRITVSAWGLREGIVFSQLASDAKGQDPLLAGVGEFAALRGCPPVLATRMAGWTADVVPRSQYGSERLRLAATMLSLASMQIEPNLRGPLAIEWSLHKRWIAIKAQDRAMLAAAVSANGNRCDLPKDVTSLAPEEALEAAICWGLATRLCRRLGARSSKLFQVSSLQIEGDALVLSLEESHEALFGIPNEKDLTLLADRLGKRPEFRVVSDAGLARIDSYAK